MCNVTLKHSAHPIIQLLAPLTSTTLSSSLIKVRICGRAQHCWEATFRTKPWKRLSKSNLSLNTWILARTFSKYQAFKKLLFSKVILEFKSLAIYQGHPTPSAQSHQELMGWPGDYHSLRHIRIQFHPTKVTQLTNLAEIKSSATLQQ